MATAAETTDAKRYRNIPIQGHLSQKVLATMIQKEPKGIGELAKQMCCDYQVQFAKIIVQANLAAVDVKVAVKGDRRAAILGKLAEQLWKRHLNDMLESFTHGRVVFEKVWKYSPDHNLTYIRKLEPLPFEVTEMKLDPDTGEFQGIVLEGKPKTLSGQSLKIPIPAPSCWWLAMDPTPLQPHGRSRLDGAPYKTYKTRQAAIALRNQFVARICVGGGIAHVPDEIEIEDGQMVDPFAAMAKAHDERMAGGILILPNERNPDGTYKYDVTDPSGVNSPAPLDDHINGLDQEQLQAFGIPPKTVVEGEAVGSFAMVSQQKLILDAVIEHILLQFERSFQEYVIDKMVEMNYEDRSAVSIQIVHEPLLSIPNQAIQEAVTAILTSPELPQAMMSGILDVRQILEQARIPLLPGAREAIERLFNLQVMLNTQLHPGAPAEDNEPPGEGQPSSNPEPEPSPEPEPPKPDAGEPPGQ